MPSIAKPRILVLAGSIRSGAFSGKTADVAQRELAIQGADVTRISLADYPLPLMDEDLEREDGIPENAMRLARLLDRHEGLLIASPEYNASIPPLLKNTLDWLSRVKHDGETRLKPLAGKIAALCSSSDGNFAGIRGLYHLRAVLMACQVDVITPQCSIPRAGEAFGTDGELKEERLRNQMEKVCRSLVVNAQAITQRIEP